MKIHGYCEQCHKVKRVRVSGHGMAMLAARHVATGICDDCEEANEKKRRNPRR